MDTSLLRKAGLTESQAKGYLALIEHGALTPAQLAETTGETRTNAYAVADKLVELGLASKTDGRGVTYSPAHPSALEILAEKRRKILVRNEQEVKQGISPLIDLFYATTAQPGTRTLQGVEGIKEVYDDTLKAKQDIYLVRTTADVPDLGLEYLDSYRQRRADAGIDTYALTPDSPIARQHRDSGADERLRFHRTMIAQDTYTAPVEINVYGNKVALLAYGKTQMATIITSPPVAEAMRQLLGLLFQALQAADGTSTHDSRALAI